MQTQEYATRPRKARCTFYASHGKRYLIIRGVSMEAVIKRLRALCPGGKFRELWEADA